MVRSSCFWGWPAAGSAKHKVSLLACHHTDCVICIKPLLLCAAVAKPHVFPCGVPHRHSDLQLREAPCHMRRIPAARVQGPKRGASDPSGYVMEDLLAHAVDNMRIKNVNRTQLARRAEQPAPSLLVCSCSHSDPALSYTNATRLGLGWAATDLRHNWMLLARIGCQQRGLKSALQMCVPI